MTEKQYELKRKDLPPSVTGARAALLLLAVLALRAAYTAWCGLPLSPDEAYYWDWSRRLAWGYYSKPPMIAALIGASTSLFGATTFGVRIAAALLGTVSLAALYRFAARLFGAQAAGWTLLALLLMPANGALNLIMTIDAPLMFFWSFALWALWAAVSAENAAPGRWLLAGLASGLALLSKQTAVALPALAGVLLVMHRPYRRHLVRGFPLYLLTTFLFAVPVLAWNAQHGWIMFQHTGSHFEAETVKLGEKLSHFAEFAGSQIALVSPVTWGLAVAAALGAGLRWRRAPAAERFLLAMGPAPLAAIYALALVREINPNWPAPFYITAVILAGGWLSGALATARRPRRAGGWGRAALWTGLVLSLLTYASPVVVRLAGGAGTDLDPADRLRGWPQLAQRIQEVRESEAVPEDSILISATHRRPVSLTAFYLPDQPFIHRWKSGDNISSQYELWPGPVDRIGDDALIMANHTPEAFPDELRGVFDELRFLEEIEVPYGPGKVHRYFLYHGRRLRQWPPGAQ
ncbi:ArnT family glycosyltransferase [Kiritimatiella glycovorans]|uniref:Glycosyl transferase family protein n=1 Tax=Kiritimatiella glycovorans TaxID=1307763 RepID=A0A0G3EJV4_9BACT|nr:glycosyltransferase family 39 protein [Kiritimatiella glycovorans]AKJ65070.1 Glycosyl transferase family protein [Kiritimatiella glycovorans]